MPTKKYALEEGGAQRIEVTWNGIWKNFQLKCDGMVVATAENQAALKQGVEGRLPDGSTLLARLETGYGNAGLKLFHDGQSLPGSAGDPKVQLKTAVGVVYFIAALNLAIGVAGLVFKIQLLGELAVGAIIFAVVFAVLGFFTMKQSRVALVIAIVIFCADALITTFDGLSAGGHVPNVGFLFVRFGLVVAMVNGVRAINALKLKAKLNASDAGQARSPGA